MADVKRMNQIIALATNGRRDMCESDEERDLYDSIKREIESYAKDGIYVEMVHEAPE